MSSRINLNQQLHEFPIAPELEGLSFVDLAVKAEERLGDKATNLELEESDALSYGDNRVFVVRADRLPGACFKWLSAMNAVAESTEAGHSSVVVPTAGSYGIGVGYAINAYGGQALSLVPRGTNGHKQSIMRELGVEVQEVDGNFDETLVEAYKVAEERGIKVLHPYAEIANIGATGVVGRRIGEKCSNATHFVAQFGGGSLHSGAASVLKELTPELHVTVAQAAGCSAFVDSLLTGKVQEAHDVNQWGYTSYFRKLGGVGVGKTDPLTLGLGSRVVDAVTTIGIDDAYATMYEYQRDHGVLPEVAAAIGLTAARNLARTPGVNGARIVAVLTGANPEAYRESYLERMFRRRQQTEQRDKPTPGKLSPALT